MNKTLFYISPFYLPNKGGVEFYIERLADYFKNQFKEIRIITYIPLTSNIKADLYEKKNNIHIHRFNWPFKNLFTKIENKNFLLVIIYLFPGLFINTVHKIIKYKCDIIHGHGFASLLIMFILSFFCKKKFILSTHAIYILKKRFILRKILSFLLTRIDHIVAVGEMSKKELILCGVNPNKISIFKNWVNENYFKPTDNINSKLNVLFVGRLIEKKGVKIFCEIAKNFPDFNFIIVGEGELEYYVKNFIKLNSQNNLKLFQSIEKDDLLRIYQKSDLFMSPILYEEGNASVFIEALACGLPIITDLRGCIPENLNSDVAYFVRSDTGFLKKFFHDYKENKIKKISKLKCREYFLKNFSSKNLISLEEIYFKN